MAKITFTSAQSTKTVHIDAKASPAPTLLAIAQAHGVPVPFNCTFGGCGACLVRIKAKTGAGGGEPACLGEEEAWLLDVMGKLSPEDTGFVETDGMIESYRLACQCVIAGDEEMEVAYEVSVGSR